jgi:hypothetical protein
MDSRQMRSRYLEDVQGVAGWMKLELGWLSGRGTRATVLDNNHF